MSGRTDLYPIMHKFVDDEYGKLRREKVLSWLFLHSGRPFRCEDFFGRPLKYEGVRFQGLPRYVFWNGYMEPFLKDIIVRAIEQTLALCRQIGVDVHPAVHETCELLRIMVTRIYEDMAGVDLELRREKGYRSFKKVDVSARIATMHRFIDAKAERKFNKI
jgi:hypothetical protein